MAELQKDICSICLHDLQQPKILDCQHQFCYKCLDDYIYKTAAKGQFLCPLCRQDITVPVGGVHDFPDRPNSENSATSDVPQCDMCEEVSSTFRCVDCRQYMCKSCKTMHGKLPVCKDHVVITLAEIYKATVGPRGDNSGKGGALFGVKDICSNHKDKTVNIYCKQCSITVCSICFISEHNGHICSDLRDETTRHNIRDELQTANTEIIKHIQTLEDFSRSLNMKHGELTACDKVDRQVVKICTEVKRLGESIKDDLKKTCREESDRSDGGKDLTKLMEDINKLTKELKDSVKYSDNVLKDNSMVQMLNRLPTVRQEEKICSLRKLEIPNVPIIITFKESDIDSDILRQQIGKIEKEKKNIYQPSSRVVTESKFIYEQSFNVNNVPIGRYVYGPEFIYSGEGCKVVVAIVDGRLYTWLNRLAGYGYIGLGSRFYTWLKRLTGYDVLTFTVKLVNHVDDKQSIIKQGRGYIYDVHCVYMIDVSRLCDPLNGFLVDNNFTIQVTKMEID